MFSNSIESDHTICIQDTQKKKKATNDGKAMEGIEGFAKGLGARILSLVEELPKLAARVCRKKCRRTKTTANLSRSQEVVIIYLTNQKQQNEVLHFVANCRIFPPAGSKGMLFHIFDIHNDVLLGGCLWRMCLSRIANAIIIPYGAAPRHILDITQTVKNTLRQAGDTGMAFFEQKFWVSPIIESWVEGTNSKNAEIHES